MLIMPNSIELDILAGIMFGGLLEKGGKNLAVTV